MKKPNVPMNHAITTCRHKVDKKKFEEGWERIWGKKESIDESFEKVPITYEDIQCVLDLMKKNEVPPKKAKNGKEYYEMRYMDKEEKIAFVTPKGICYDPITGEKLDFT